MRNPFSIFLTSVVTVRKADGRTFEKVPCSVKDTEIEIHDATLPLDSGDIVARHLPNGREELYRIENVIFKEGIAGHIPDVIVLSCARLDSSMPVFATHYTVTLIRDRDAPSEQHWQTRMGGDLDRKALFYSNDRVKTGDEIESEFFDEPRVITRVKACFLIDSSISHWDAEIVPRSEWHLRQRAPQPSVVVSGQGARFNFGSIDQSVQHFHNYEANAALLEALEEIRDAIQDSDLPPVVKTDAALDLDQIKSELQRPKSDKDRIATLLDRLNSVAGLAEKIAKLVPLLNAVIR